MKSILVSIVHSRIHSLSPPAAIKRPTMTASTQRAAGGHRIMQRGAHRFSRPVKADVSVVVPNPYGVFTKVYLNYAFFLSFHIWSPKWVLATGMATHPSITFWSPKLDRPGSRGSGRHQATPYGVSYLSYLSWWLLRASRFIWLVRDLRGITSRVVLCVWREVFVRVRVLWREMCFIYH